MRSTASREIRLTLLGESCLTIDGALVAGVTANFFRIAAYLVLAGAQGIASRQRVSALIWSDTDDGKATVNLRQALARIRHMQDEHKFRLIGSNSSTLYLVPDHNVRCDLIDFVEQLAGRRSISPAELCELYGGDLLSGLDEAGNGYEEWLAGQRDSIRFAFIDKVTAAIEPDGPLSTADRSACARRILMIDPYNEDAIRALMREAAEHRQVARLNHLYDSISAVLAEDLGVTPSSDTQSLYVKLLHSMTD